MDSKGPDDDKRPATELVAGGEPIIELEPPHFFEKDSVGSEIFRLHICPFLTVKDLVVCARTGHTFHRLCRTYTIIELLKEKPMGLVRSHRIELGKTVMKSVVKFRGDDVFRPTRVVLNGPNDNFKAQLYHPEELKDVHAIIDGYLQLHGCVKHFRATNPSTGVPLRTPKDTYFLVSAFFQPLDSNWAPEFTLDVTNVVEKLIQEQGGRCLVLRPPPLLRSAQGRRVKSPSTWKWWYTRLFGDPCPGVQKILLINAKCTRDGENRVFKVLENQSVTLHLQVPPSEENNSPDCQKRLVNASNPVVSSVEHDVPYGPKSPTDQVRSEKTPDNECRPNHQKRTIDEIDHQKRTMDE